MPKPKRQPEIVFDVVSARDGERVVVALEDELLATAEAERLTAEATANNQAAHTTYSVQPREAAPADADQETPA